jgi:hypothetical protein
VPQPLPRRSTRQTKTARPPKGRGSGVRQRLKRDRFLFVMCLGALALLTAAFALSWWMMGGILPLVLALVSVAAACGLFYLRDA